MKKSGVPYTFIDVGIWYQASVPRPSSDTSNLANLLRQFSGPGDKKSAVINREHIGNWVARIIQDPRTLNQYVFFYEDELTLAEIFEMASRALGEDFRANADKVRFYPSPRMCLFTDSA